MSKIPTKPTDTAALIYQSYENQPQDCFRQHLGASLIGKSCRRALWYDFHGCTRPSFPGRVLRLFQRGQDEELTFAGDLRAIGCELHTVEPETGDQYRVTAHGGHFGGSLDGALHNLPEAPSAWHVVEMKTHNDKSFKQLCKDGVEKSKPQHYAQMQVYMHLTGMHRALYLAVNKNDDSIYSERVHYSKDDSEELLDKAGKIIFAPEPLERISEKPDWYECKWCEHHAICHQQKVPEVHCRTCARSTALPDGTWQCDHGNDTLSYQDQLHGCHDHLFIPSLIPYATMIGFDDDKGVHYKLEDGREFYNTTEAGACANCYTSKELQVIDPAMIGHAGVDEARELFAGRATA